MIRKLSAVVVLGLCVGAGLALRHVPDGPAAARERVVFVAGGLADDDLIAFTANLAASGHPGAWLLDSPGAGAANRDFLGRFHPERTVPVGSFAAGLEERLGVPTSPAVAWKHGPAPALWNSWFPRAEQVVVCPARPRGLLLQAACLAGAVPAPLVVLHGAPGETEELRQRLADWGTRKVFAAGAAGKVCRALGDVAVAELAREDAVAACYLRHQLAKGPVRTLVVANPADTTEGFGGVSRLAPWVALERRAALLLTNPAGSNTAEVVADALKHPALAHADALLLVANLKAIPTERRANPVPGKDAFIEMEPLTPAGLEPFSFATGRLFHEELGVVPLLLARQRLLAPAAGPRRALIVSNPGGSLPLLETFSRHTALELRNGGYELTALFGHDCSREKVRRLLPEQDIFMWEGHYRTMVDDYELPRWTEPLPPSFVFLQSCLALNEKEAQPLLQRGALAVLGSATRNYSGSGGAFSLAYFDALLHDDQTLGGALRAAKNFLLAYSLLKEKRLGDEAKLQGANLRSAWAFALWGDPTLKLPRPEPTADALPAVRHEVRGNTIVVTLPDEVYAKVRSMRYQAQMWPNSRLAGLVSRDPEEESRNLVPLVFAEVHLPKAPANKVPRLHSALASRNWVFSWDARRKTGYLLVAPRSKEKQEIRFQVKWDDA